MVARIAVRAAREALAEHAATSPRQAELAPPRASATVGGGTARLGLTMDLPYPTNLAGASRAVQDHVSRRVSQLTGLRITEVTLAIEHLVLSDGLEHRRVQ
ncbi:Asp23/Gls24 family envelope stress response protein [Streptomyces sp. NPDC059851]|uniref:Asp23/Gls24 family envelope stress response protein n=1 Tax=Streptomyces sp. NPDC059851 TaxID=3346971 RepID=UPI00364ED0DD